MRNLWVKTLLIVGVMFAVATAGNILGAPCSACLRLGASNTVAHALHCGLNVKNFIDATLVSLVVGAIFFFRNRRLLERTLVNACIHHEVNTGLMCLSLAQSESERVAAARRISMALDQHCPVHGLKIKTAVEYIRKHGATTQKTH